jgi:hypothetical protein
LIRHACTTFEVAFLNDFAGPSYGRQSSRARFFSVRIDCARTARAADKHSLRIRIDYANEDVVALVEHLHGTGVRIGVVVVVGHTDREVGEIVAVEIADRERGAETIWVVRLGLFRNRNLLWRQSYEFDFAGGRWDRDNTVAAFDPWGWQAPMGVDPWAWRFRTANSDPLLHNAGSYSTNLWKPGEAPPLD